MPTNSATGSAAPSVQKWIIDSDVEYQLRSGALKNRLDDSLSHGFIELYLRCPNLTAIGWGEQDEPFSYCPSLLRVDLSGCPKLESIAKFAFLSCHHLISVVFGEHSNITNLGLGSFQECNALTSIALPNDLKFIEGGAFANCTSLERVVCNKHLKTIGEYAFDRCLALTSITLPNKLEVIEELAFTHCSALERVVFNKNLKTIGKCAFGGCSKLEDVQLASSSISFRDVAPFFECYRLIEIAAAAGFPSNEPKCTVIIGVRRVGSDRVVPYLIDLFEKRMERRRIVLVAHMRFKKTVHALKGTEKERITAMKLQYNDESNGILSASLLSSVMRGGGVEGVLGTILGFV